MKRFFLPLILAWLMVVSLVGCGTPDSDTALQGAGSTELIAEADIGVPYETLDAIESALKTFFSERDEDASIYVFGDDGTLDISLNAEGMVMGFQTVFPDYANALVIQSQKLAAEYDLSISQISITFTAGEDNLRNWTTYDCTSGILADTYDGGNLVLVDQTIEDLVDRYGTEGWFYTIDVEE